MQGAICHSCTTSLDEAITVECKGFCSAIFHLKCTGISENTFKEMFATKQLFWLCKPCASLMSDMRFRRSIKAAHAIGQQHETVDHAKLVEQLKEELLGPLKEEIGVHISKLVNSSALTPTSSRRPPARQRFVNARRVFDDRPNRGAALTQGEGSAEATIPTAPVRSSGPKFWLYLARIATEVTAEQVANFAKSRLETNDVEVTRLVAKGMNVSTMRNISFRVGVAESLRDKALSAATWPRGVYFREFENRSVTSKDFTSALHPSDPPVLSAQRQTRDSSSSSGMETPEDQMPVDDEQQASNPMTQ